MENSFDFAELQETLDADLREKEGEIYKAGDVLYTVYCRNCGCDFEPTIKSPLWWRAKKSSDKGRLDAISISGEECGCIKPIPEPNAPYRVLGITWNGGSYNMPFFNMINAIKTFINAEKSGDTVIIKGISRKTEWAARNLAWKQK